MAIKFVIDVDGPVALVDTVEDYEDAIAKLECPVIVPPELAEALGLRRVADDPELLADLLGDPLYEEDARWATFGSEAVH